MYVYPDFLHLFKTGERSRLKQLALDYTKLLNLIEETDKFVIKECKAFVKDAKVKYKEEQDGRQKDENVPLIAKYCDICVHL